MKLKKILSLSILVFVLTIFSNVKAETFTADKEWSKMKPGDVIYFDNSSTKWSKVYIYIWEKQGNTDKDKYKEWDKADEMQKVEGTDNIYSFTVPDDMTPDKYNMLIFKNGNNGDQNQTIDLGFIEEGFAYKINSDNTGKRVGYWYLYDTSDITKRLESAKKYQADKQYYTSESYGDLDNYIQDVVDKLNKEILLEEQKQDNGNGTGKYYIDIDVTLANIDNVVDGLKTDKSILENKVKEIEEKLEQDKDKYTDESIKEC